MRRYSSGKNTADLITLIRKTNTKLKLLGQQRLIGNLNSLNQEKKKLKAKEDLVSGVYLKNGFDASNFSLLEL